MPENWSERARTYQLASSLLILSDGLMGDSDFDVSEHIMIVQVCGWNPKTEEDVEAMNLTTMGKKLPREMMEKIETRHERMIGD